MTATTTAAAQQALAEQAVTWAYPLYEMRRMRAATSPRRTEAGQAAPEGMRWCNLFTHARQLLRAGTSRVVTPNNDTLYTNAWLDLGAGPLVIDVPDTAGRYYVLGLLDFYTNPFAHIGPRLTGTQARSFLVTPPGWSGALPAGFDAPGAHIQAPTRWLWVIGRILVDGPRDLAAAHALQDGFSMAPLADWLAGQAAVAPVPRPLRRTATRRPRPRQTTLPPRSTPRCGRIHRPLRSANWWSALRPWAWATAAPSSMTPRSGHCSRRWTPCCRGCAAHSTARARPRAGSCHRW